MNTYFGTIAIVKNLVLRKKAVSLDLIIIERNERKRSSLNRYVKGISESISQRKLIKR